MFQDAETEEVKKFIAANTIHIIISATNKNLSTMRIQTSNCNNFKFKTSLFLYRCKEKLTNKTIYDNFNEEVVRRRQPSAVYCKYEVSHSFTSIDECNDHHNVCPKKGEFLKKAELCHEKFTNNKAWIKTAQEAKRRKEERLGGNPNAPKSN